MTNISLSSQQMSKCPLDRQWCLCFLKYLQRRFDCAYEISPLEEKLQCVTSAAKVRMASAAVRAVSQVKIFPAVRFLAVLATKRMDWMCCFGNVLLDVWFNRRREGGADQWTGRDGDRVLSAGESAWGVLFARTDSMILTRRCSLLNVRNDNRYHCSIQNQALKSPHHR